MLFGHVIGAVISIALSRYGNIRAKVLDILKIGNLLIGISLISLVFFKDVYVIGGILAIWGAIMEVIYSYDMVVPNIMYPHVIMKRVMTLLVTAWPTMQIFTPLLFYLLGSWKSYLVIFVGVPHLFVAYFFFANSK